MKIDILTLFPEFFDGFKSHSIIGRAIGTGKIELHTHNLRDWSKDKYKTVDDHPYGGGPGMVLKVDVVVPAIRDIKKNNPEAKVLLMTPQGTTYKQEAAASFTKESGLIIVCGHYEGFDERIREYVDMEISVGDYVLTGGELPAMIIADSVARLLPGVLGDDQSSQVESFSPSVRSTNSGQALTLEAPHYTRPEEFEGKKVPQMLMSGNHAKIEEWRKAQAQEKTKKRRPDLIGGKV